MIQRVTFPLSAEIAFEETIDVRSPSEFVEDHVSGAVNLPVLFDEERARVGRIYKQVSAFEARKLGAAVVSRNIAHHLETHFSEKSKNYAALLYCWRGGQRSGSLATVLSNIGWKVYLVDGGYREYRRHVLESIEESAEKGSFVVLNGYTGAGKTLILKEVQRQGGQILDLEGLACHKGSVFGGDPDQPQPQQKRFESLLHDELAAFDFSEPIYIEAESAKIGRLNIPNALWQKMKIAPVIEIDSPLEARARYLTNDYEEWLGDIGRIHDTLDRLKGFHADKRIAEWKTFATERNWHRLVTELLDDHYDRRYTVCGTGHFEVPSNRVSLPSHESGQIAQSSHEVMKIGKELCASEALSC